MQSSDKLPPLIVIIGPTAVGKTELSIRLAKQFKGEIISADSRLFYKDMTIGTAKPTQQERSDVKHHLIDFLSPLDSFSLGDFQKAVYDISIEIEKRKHLSFLVGGTGQYIRAITEGWVVPSQPPSNILRGALEKIAKVKGPRELQKWLQVLDPQSAAAIDYRNTRRIIRALEVTLFSGRPFSSSRERGAVRFYSMIIGLQRDRQELYHRIDLRIEQMIENGFVQEVQNLINSGVTAQTPAMSAIGYKEIMEYALGITTLENAIDQIKKRTRILVRRQANWFKPGDPNIHWIDMNDKTLTNATALISGFLEKRSDE